MAIEKGLRPFSFPANVDLSTKQNFLVTLSSDGEVAVTASLGALALGVVTNDPASTGRAASVQMLAGTVVKVACTTVAAGAKEISINSLMISSTLAGRARASSTGGTAYVFGRSLATLSTELSAILPILITHEGVTSEA